MKTILSIMLAALLCALLQACGGDIASPFDKPDHPDETIETPSRAQGG